MSFSSWLRSCSVVAIACRGLHLDANRRGKCGQRAPRGAVRNRQCSRVGAMGYVGCELPEVNGLCSNVFQMLAAVTRRGCVALVQKPQPRLDPGWALVRMRVAGICNTDIEILRGYHD